MDGQSGVTEGGGKDSDIMSKLLSAVMDGTEANKTMAGAVVEQGLAMKPILLGVAKEMKLKNKRAALDYDRELRASALANDMTVPQYRAYLEEQYGDED